MTADRPPLGAFAAVGIEMEYMIVRKISLDVFPVADRLLEAVAGEPASELEHGALAWSNELALHVIELKTNGPAAGLDVLPGAFLRDVREINELLAPLGGRLMPTSAHPWMDPLTETRLWPYEYNEVYQAYDRIFGCRGHGWSNLQSVHINLPFHGDREFGALHAAVRLLLPLLPALAASSPFLDGRPTGLLDSRLQAYRGNAARVPSVAGELVPEPVYSRSNYEQQILQPMYRDIAELDPGGVLQHEWLNSRGAIARFDRSSIEIRLLDIQETPRADLAIAAAVTEIARHLYVRALAGDLPEVPTGTLARILDGAVRGAERARIAQRRFLSALGLPGSTISAGELWRGLIEKVPGLDPWRQTLDAILAHGTLSRRLLAAAGPDPDHQRLLETYRELCECLHEDRLFLA